MSKFAVLFGRADRPSTTLDFLNGAPAIQPQRRTFTELGTQIGSDHESLRDLLVHVERKIHELDDLKDAFEDIVAPVSATILALETEKSLAFSLNESLTATRDAYDALKREAHEMDQAIGELEFERSELRHALDRAHQTGAELDRQRTELSAQLASQVKRDATKPDAGMPAEMKAKY